MMSDTAVKAIQGAMVNTGSLPNLTTQPVVLPNNVVGLDPGRP